MRNRSHLLLLCLAVWLAAAGAGYGNEAVVLEKKLTWIKHGEIGKRLVVSQIMKDAFELEDKPAVGMTVVVQNRSQEDIKHFVFDLHLLSHTDRKAAPVLVDLGTDASLAVKAGGRTEITVLLTADDFTKAGISSAAFRDLMYADTDAVPIFRSADPGANHRKIAHSVRFDYDRLAPLQPWRACVRAAARATGKKAQPFPASVPASMLQTKQGWEYGFGSGKSCRVTGSAAKGFKASIKN